MPSSPSARSGSRLHLAALLAVVAAFLLVPTASALAAEAPAEISFAGEGAGWVKGEEGALGGLPHVECHWSGTEIDVGTSPAEGSAVTGLHECRTMAQEDSGLVGIIVSHGADAGSKFAGWTVLLGTAVSCVENSPGAGSCGVLSFGEQEIIIRATFDPIPKPKLTINHTGTGIGQVNCEVNGEPTLEEPCAAKYEEGTELKLFAEEGAHSEFIGFENGGGDASGCSTSPCGPFTLAEDSELDARFELIPHELSVEAIGEGSVSAATGAISGCEEGAGTCSGTYGESEAVTLTATPGEHKVVQWSGCSEAVANVCEVQIPAGDATVQAEFVEAPHRTLTVEATGAGSVGAEEPPAPLSGQIAGCEEGGGECSASYYEGDAVTLTASPGAHQQVAWSGCTMANANTCQVQLPAGDATVKAQFTTITHRLNIGTAGSGSGSVSCDGGPCAGSYPEGTTIALTATAASGSTFGGFSGGGCSGSPCALTLEADTTVSATFNANPQPPPVPEQKGTATAKGTAPVKGNKAMLTLACTGGECKGSLQLYAKVKQGGKQKSKIIGKASFAIAAGATKTVKVKIANGQVRKLLGRGKTVKAQLRGTGLRPRTVKLKPQGKARPKRHRKRHHVRAGRPDR